MTGARESGQKVAGLFNFWKHKKCKRKDVCLNRNKKNYTITRRAKSYRVELYVTVSPISQGLQLVKRTCGTRVELW